MQKSLSYTNLEERKDENTVDIKCPHCGVNTKYINTNDELEEAMHSINNCTNCLADISLQGKWTNQGWGIINILANRFGQEKLLFILQKNIFRNEL